MRTMTIARRLRCAHVAGYTLIEILAVLAVIGIVAALIQVSFAPNPLHALEDEARRLAVALESARDQAVTGGCTIAWTRRGNAHRFECIRARGDLHASGGEQIWPGAIELERILVAGNRMPRDTPLYFTPSGVNAPFELVFAQGEHRVALAGDALGRIAISRRVQSANAR